MSELIIGIDLGTTNSEVAIVQNGKVTVIAADGKKILPSAVGITHDGSLLVGETAKNQYVIYPERTILSIKRKMGSADKVLLADTAYTPQEISAMILKRLKSIAESYLQQSVTKAVITVPAYFSDVQRQATREAGALAGLDVVRIINEPTAAALAYEVQTQEKKCILVYDLGGGTFDVSIVSLQNQVVEVLASGGNNHLGGDDFDAKIIDYVNQHLQEQGINANSSAQAQAKIRRAAEVAKITLSDHPFANIEEEYLLDHQGKPYHLSLELSRTQYEEMIKDYIDETLESVHQALADANLLTKDIHEIVLVGGSSRTPMITERLAEIFHHRPRAEIDPELCVAAGAAIQAAVIAGEKCDAVLVDITPYAFGTSCVGLLDDMPYQYVYKAIIPKNTPIPVTKSEVFGTMVDRQEVVEVCVYQGENKDALENIKLGEFRIEGLSPVPAGNMIILNLKLDADGILHVTAIEKKTGLEKKIVINNAIAQFSQDKMIEAKKRLDHLFENDLLSSPVHLHQHDKVQLLIKKAEDALDKISSEDREDLVNLIETIKDAIANNNESALSTYTDKLSDMLFYLEVETA